MRHDRLSLFRVVLLICVLAFTPILSAQNVSVTLLPPPPNQMHISDLWHILLYNLDNQSYKVYLHGTGYLGTDKSGRLIADAQTRVFDLPPSRTPLRITGSFVQPVKVNKSDPHYESIVKNTGTVPSGEYFICVSVVDASSSAVFSEACLVQNVEQLSPPVLVQPTDESTVLDSLPSFSWLPPSPVPATMQLRYKLKIVEVLGTQSAQQAMLANPPLFERSDIIPPLFTYPFTARPMKTGSKYAWSVTALTGIDKTPLGESEIWWFRYQDSVALRKRVDSIPNPITGGLIVAGDQFSAGIFQVKKEQRLVISNLKNSINASGLSKYQFTSGSDFSGRVVNNNLNANEIGLTASANGSSAGMLSKNNTFVADNTTLKQIKDGINAVAAKPSIENMLWTWGRNLEGQVGFMAAGWYSDVPVPYDIRTIEQMACGANHILMLLKDGTLWAWGDNQFGQLANSSLRESNVALPVAVPGSAKIIAIAAGMGTSFALRGDGSIYAWGFNAHGELGIYDDTLHEQVTPRLVDASTVKFRSIAAHGGHVLAVATDGSVYSWGSNYYGEVGVGARYRNVNYPTEVLNASVVKDNSKGKETISTPTTAMMMATPTVGFKTISVGEHFSFASNAKGNEVYAWGRNASGQLLLGTTKDTVSPTQTTLSSVDSISAGGAHTMVWLRDGSLKAGGNNIAGQLGDPDLGIRSEAKTVDAIGQVIALCTGAGHTMVIRKSGGLWTWGLNNAGQLAVTPIHDVIFSNKPAVAPARIVSLEQ